MEIEEIMDELEIAAGTLDSLIKEYKKNGIIPENVISEALEDIMLNLDEAQEILESMGDDDD